MRGRHGINPGDAVASILVLLWHHSSEPVPIGAAASPFIALYPEIHMATPPQNMKTAILDLKDIPLDQLEELGASPLAHAVALYQERLKKNGVPLSSFNARV
jgi:hypothetical protein